MHAVLQPLASLQRPPGDPLILVLDDYHEVASPLVDEMVALLLERLPPALHLAIATRSEPALPIPRLRARGQLTEIGIADLRFRADEAQLFLRETMGVHLAEAAQTTLVARTEGWAAGLQLAALSLRTMASDEAEEFVGGFGGSDRFVADYLVEEVLEAQPPDRREFLLRTSILRRMCAPLCAALSAEGEDGSGRSGEQGGVPPSAATAAAQAQLQECERLNLFLIPLDHQRSWYRYHHLFGGLLQARLRAQGGESTAALHRRAGSWYAGSGDAEEAMHHLLAAGDIEAAADLAEQYGVHMVGGSRLLTFLRWGEQLGDAVIRRRALLCAGYGWATVLTGQIDRALAYVAAGEAALTDDTGVVALPYGRFIGPAETRGHLYAVRAYAARMCGDAPAVQQYARAALAELPADADVVRCTLALNLGLLEMEHGRNAEAMAAFEEAHASGSRNAANLFVAISALGLQSDLHLRAGRLDQAERLCLQAIAEGEQFGAQAPPAVGVGYLGLANIHLLRGELDAAQSRLDKGMRLAEQIAFSESMEEIWLLRMQIALAGRHYAQAAELLAAAEARLQTTVVGAPLRRRWALLHVLLALALGDTQGAKVWVVQDGPEHPAPGEARSIREALHQRELLTKARVCLAQGETRQARGLLERISEQAVWLHCCERAVLLAQCCAAEGHERGAIENMAQAVRMAAPQRVRLPFLVAGEPSAGLLRKILVQAEDVAQRAFVAGVLQQIGEAAPTADNLAEPLSEREREVLQLLAAGYTNAQIAETLIVAPSTVKTHTNHILAKLGAQNRTQAVARARELGLLTG